MRASWCHITCTFRCYDRTDRERVAQGPCWKLSQHEQLHTAGTGLARCKSLWPFSGPFLQIMSSVSSFIFSCLFFLTNAPMLPNRKSRGAFNEMCEWFHHTVVNKGLNIGDTSQEGLRWTEIPGKGRHAHSFWSSRPSASNPEGFMLSLPELWPIFKEPRI